MPDPTQKHDRSGTTDVVSLVHCYCVMRKFFMGVTALILSAGVMSHVQAQQVVNDNLPSQSAPILQSVIESARQSAKEDYQVDDHDLAQPLKDMDYQAYRAIRFDQEKSLWHNENDYEVQFFHPGFLYQQPITVHVVNRQNQASELPFSSEAFNYDDGAQQFAGLTDKSSGFAGFRVHYPIKNSDYKDEFAVFLGASYFRLVGKEHVYGISARGLAIDTGLPKGEEFPHFTEFWLIEPGDGQPVTIYARLESPSVSGAYKFTLMPGEQTQADVQAWLFAREDIEKLGIAPFTSMFLYGENSQNKPDDYRPEVHDSDGVSLVTHNGEQIWRPLTNPSRLQFTSLSDSQPRGFGMLQRDTAFASYLDSEAHYHKRPGLWVTPETGFGSGRIELVEIPTDSETHDNIVAYWVPDAPMAAGDERYFAYTLSSVTTSPDSDVMTVVGTYQGATVLPGEKQANNQQRRRFVVDFALPEVSKIDVNALSLSVAVNQGQIIQPRVFPIENGTLLRATFVLAPQGNMTADMRMYINQNDKRVSEVWNYVYQAK